MKACRRVSAKHHKYKSKTIRGSLYLKRWWDQWSSAQGLEGAQCSIECGKCFEVSGCWSVFGRVGTGFSVLNQQAAVRTQWRECCNGVVWENSGRLTTSHVQSNRFPVFCGIGANLSLSQPVLVCSDLTHSAEPHSQGLI